MQLYRQEAVSERTAHVIARSTLAQWVRHGDLAGRIGDDAAASEALGVQRKGALPSRV